MSNKKRPKMDALKVQIITVIKTIISTKKRFTAHDVMIAMFNKDTIGANEWNTHYSRVSLALRELENEHKLQSKIDEISTQYIKPKIYTVVNINGKGDFK